MLRNNQDQNSNQQLVPFQNISRIKRAGIGLFSATALVGDGAVNTFMFAKLLSLFSTKMPTPVSWILILATLIPEFPLHYTSRH